MSDKIALPKKKEKPVMPENRQIRNDFPFGGVLGGVAIALVLIYLLL